MTISIDDLALPPEQYIKALKKLANDALLDAAAARLTNDDILQDENRQKNVVLDALRIHESQKAEQQQNKVDADTQAEPNTPTLKPKIRTRECLTLLIHDYLLRQWGIKEGGACSVTSVQAWFDIVEGNFNSDYIGEIVHGQTIVLRDDKTISMDNFKKAFSKRLNKPKKLK